MAAAFPEDLKAYKRFLVQANQIQKVDIRVAYYCRLHALTKMLAKPANGGLPNPKDPAVKDIVNGVMMKLETDKKTFEEPLDPETDFEAVKAMAENVFATADSQDRDGTANIRTSHAFMTSFVLYEVLEVFSDKNSKADPEIQQKLKYAKWKAADIGKAIKEGRTPSRGGPNEKLDDLEDNELGRDGPPNFVGREPQPLVPADDEPEDAGASAPPPDLPAPPRGQSFKRLPFVPPIDENKKQEDDDLPGYFDAAAKDIEVKSPRGAAAAKKIHTVAAKVKKRIKGINPKDAPKLKKLKEIEVLAREALSAIRFNDTGTAKAKLREAIQELDGLGIAT